MHVTLVSSLDASCRQQACEAIATAHPAAVVVFHDLLENGLVIRRIFGRAGLIERGELLLEHGCLSCTVRLDVVPTIERLLAAGEDHIVLGLPPAVPCSTALGALKKGLMQPFTVDSAVLACAPDAVEDHIWDHHTLFESGFTPIPEDLRTSGEFLIGELSFNDTVLLSDPVLVPVDPDGRLRGVQLIRELAPHADVAEDADSMRPGRHDYSEAVGRTFPGSVRVPAASASPFSTVTHRSQRPLHPERFRCALATLAEGCCWLRGHLWIAAAPGSRIAVQGIGPRVWLENTGPWLADQASPHPSRNRAADTDSRLDWHPDFGDRGSVIAATGEGIDSAEIARLLAGCELTDAEMEAEHAELNDPFHLSPTRPD
jgi:G3E family GTPase